MIFTLYAIVSGITLVIRSIDNDALTVGDIIFSFLFGWLIVPALLINRVIGN